MDKIKKILFILPILLGVTYTLSAQSLTTDYRMAIGLRAGETSGLTMKFMPNNSTGIELIAGMWSRWLSLTGLYEKNTPAFNVAGMKWYYGAGGHIAFETVSFYNDDRNYNRGDGFALGVDGILGIEYKIPPIPFAVSLDVKPLFEIYNDGDVYLGLDPGIGVKFTF